MSFIFCYNKILLLNLSSIITLLYFRSQNQNNSNFKADLEHSSPRNISKRTPTPPRTTNSINASKKTLVKLSGNKNSARENLISLNGNFFL